MHGPILDRLLLSVRAVCCHSPMKVNAVITEPEVVRKILYHLVKIGRGSAAGRPRRTT